MRRFIRFLRVWWRVLQLKRRGFRTRVIPVPGCTVINVYNSVLLTDVVVVK